MSLTLFMWEPEEKLEELIHLNSRLAIIALAISLMFFVSPSAAFAQGNAPNAVLSEPPANEQVPEWVDEAKIFVFYGKGNPDPPPGKGPGPKVKIESPEDGATVSGTVTISGTASDKDGVVTKVEVDIDGAKIWENTYSSSKVSWSVDWDTTTASDGGHVITAKATDDDGKTSEDSITVTVSNAPAPGKDSDNYALIQTAWDMGADNNENVEYPHYGSNILYRVNPEGAPDGAVDDIIRASENWDAAVADNLYLFDRVDTSLPRWYSRDNVNAFVWRKFLPRDIVAFAVVWYDKSSVLGQAWDEYEQRWENVYETVEVDVVFNTFYKWRSYTQEKPKGKFFYVQEIATHEIGHSLGLDDLYEDRHSELTMYGYTSPKETKKMTLEVGDIAGAVELYDHMQ